MTLVVAQKKGVTISAVSDTGTTEHGVQLAAEKHIPKICILAPDLAVAFAGSSDLALRCFAEFDLTAHLFPTQIIGHFLKFHLAHAQSVDFIVMFAKPMPKLVKIANGREASSLSQTAWIGDRDAFEQFQSYRNDKERKSITSGFEVPLLVTNKELELLSDSVTFKLIAAMRYVIIDRGVPHVFGQAVGVSNVDGDFNYRPYAFVLDELRLSLLLPNALIRRITPELQELREFAASCFVTGAASKRQGIAFHFMRDERVTVLLRDTAILVTMALVKPRLFQCWSPFRRVAVSFRSPSTVSWASKLTGGSGVIPRCQAQAAWLSSITPSPMSMPVAVAPRAARRLAVHPVPVAMSRKRSRCFGETRLTTWSIPSAMLLLMMS